MCADARFTLIHRAHRLGDILASFEGRLGGAEVFPIRPHAGAKAHRVVVIARKGSRAPLQLWPGLDLHPAGQQEKHTPLIEAMLRGEVRF